MSDLHGVRWSGLVSSRCARRVRYEHDGQAADEPDERTRAMWARGRRYEQIIADELADELAGEGVVDLERQLVLDWPHPDRVIGQTHVDLAAPVGDSVRVVEVKSNAGAKVNETSALQVSGQAMLVAGELERRAADMPRTEPLPDDLWPDADDHVDAIVVAVDSHTGERRDHLVDWHAYRPAVEALWLLAEQAVAADQLPDRVAETPSDARCMFCPFKTTCWEGFERPELDAVFGLDEVAAELAELDGRIRFAGEQTKALVERRDALRDQLRAHLPANEQVTVGPLRVKLSVFDVTTFSYSEARDAGLALPDEFEPYITTNPREKWTGPR